MTKPVVLIAEELSPATVEALGPDFEIVNVDGTDRPALLKALATADAILVRSATQVDAEAIAAAPKLKVVARLNIGSHGLFCLGPALRMFNIHGF